MDFKKWEKDIKMGIMIFKVIKLWNICNFMDIIDSIQIFKSGYMGCLYFFHMFHL